MPTYYLAIVGTIADGYTFFGPFDSAETATEWCEKNQRNAPWEITNLITPEQFDESEP